MHTVLLETPAWALLPLHSWFCMRECSIVLRSLDRNLMPLMRGSLFEPQPDRQTYQTASWFLSYSNRLPSARRHYRSIPSRGPAGLDPSPCLFGYVGPLSVCPGVSCSSPLRQSVQVTAAEAPTDATLLDTSARCQRTGQRIHSAPPLPSPSSHSSQKGSITPLAS